MLESMEWQTYNDTPYQDTTPLKPGTFRIVHIFAGHWSEPMKCSLHRREFRVISSSRDSGYRALSYAWGAQGAKDIIYVNNYKVEVTLNLFCAMRYLRRKKKTITLWIDALVCLQYLAMALLSTSSIPLQPPHGTLSGSSWMISRVPTHV